MRLPRSCSSEAIEYAVRAGSPDRPTTAHVRASSSIRSTVARSCQESGCEVGSGVVITTP